MKYSAFALKWVAATLTGILLALTTGALAQTPGPAIVMKPGFARAEALERIFADLAVAENDSVARYKAEEMWKIFLMTPDAETAENMNRALRARGGFNFEKAIGLLNGIIERHPGYVEAWNQRATIRFLQRDFDASMADCEKVLELEPRHLGCLSGMAIIFVRHQKKYDEGRAVLSRAMNLHPRIGEKSLLLEIPEGK